MRCGVRCAETTPTSNRTPNSASASAAASMVGQSESLPMIRPTAGPGLPLSLMRIPSVGPNAVRHPVRRTLCLLPHLGDVLAEHVDVPDLAVRALALAVEVHLG